MLDGWICGLYVGFYILVVILVVDILLVLVWCESGWCLVSLDFNVCFDLQLDIDFWWCWVEVFVSYVYLIKVSEEDLVLFYFGCDFGEVVCGWLNLCCWLVFVIYGGVGVSVYCIYGSWSCLVDIVLLLCDMVGVGDIFQVVIFVYFCCFDVDSLVGLVVLLWEVIDVMFVFVICVVVVICLWVGLDLLFVYEF